MNAIDANDIGFFIGIIGVIGMIFTVYNYFKNPQIRAEKLDALLDQRVKFTNEINNNRFCDLQNDIKKSFELAQNHSNEALAGIKELTVVTNDMGKQVVRLQTIIEERLPRK